MPSSSLRYSPKRRRLLQKRRTSHESNDPCRLNGACALYSGGSRRRAPELVDALDGTLWRRLRGQRKMLRWNLSEQRDVHGTARWDLAPFRQRSPSRSRTMGWRRTGRRSPRRNVAALMDLASRRKLIRSSHEDGVGPSSRLNVTVQRNTKMLDQQKARRRIVVV
jgi:hypothetical protein